MNLYRIVLPVMNIERADRFYSYVFDMPGKRVSPGRHYFKLGQVILALYDPDADGDEGIGQWNFHENQYLYFAVADLESIHLKLLSSECLDVDKRIRVMPWGERLFYARDPFSNPICFVDEKTVFGL